MVLHLARRDLGHVFVGHPAGVHAVHVNSVLAVVRRRGARHHVERGLGHVRVRMARRLVVAVELSFHGRHVHDVLVTIRRAPHERLETRVDQERCNRVHQLHFQKLHTRHFIEQQAPRIPLAQIDLLQVLIELARREKLMRHQHVVKHEGHLRERGRMRETDALQRGPTLHYRRGATGIRIGKQLRATQSFVGTEDLTSRW